jgi:hypothetical protein
MTDTTDTVPTTWPPIPEDLKRQPLPTPPEFLDLDKIIPSEFRDRIAAAHDRVVELYAEMLPIIIEARELLIEEESVSSHFAPGMWDAIRKLDGALALDALLLIVSDVCCPETTSIDKPNRIRNPEAFLSDITGEERS